MAPKRSKKNPTATATATTSSSKRKATTAPTLANMETFGIEFAEQRSWDFFELLSKRTIKPTKFFHRDSVRKLGVEAEVDKLIKGLGWEEFAKMSAPTYKRLTLEFLSSARKNLVEDEDGDSVVELSFQVFGRQYKLNHNQINALFSIDSEHGFITNPRSECANNYDENSWWRELTGDDGDFFSASAKSSAFHHPAIRIMSRLLIYALFSKGATGALSGTELGGLWLATQEEQGVLDFGQLLISPIIEVRDSHLNKSDILLGGMLTLLVRLLPNNPHAKEMAALPPVAGGEFLNIRAMYHATWLHYTTNEAQWI